MMNPELELISKLWKNLCGSEFDLSELAARMHDALGHDGCDTTPEDLQLTRNHSIDLCRGT